MGEREVQRAARYARPLSVMMLDVDHFKRVNDTWGHAAGDIVLHGVAQEIQRQIRILDLLGRYGRLNGDSENILGRFGGEEFGLLFPETTLAGALVVAERIRASIQALVFTVQGGVDAHGQETSARIQVTVSIGVVSLTSPTEGFLDLSSRADQALYQAKETGRNRVCGIANSEKNSIHDHHECPALAITH
jgi:PleD family two-component response regulator